MRIRSEKDLAKQLDMIINWESLELYPLELFKLQAPYTERDVIISYHKLARRFHPDMNLSLKEEAEIVFKIIGAAKEYLLHCCNPSDCTPMHFFENCFYRKLHAKPLQQQPREKSFKDMYFIELMQAFEQGAYEETIPYLKNCIQKHPVYLDYETPLWGRTIVYLAALVNAHEFFAWLLEQKTVKPERSSIFGLNAIHAAIGRHNEILTLISQKYGGKWLKKQLEQDLWVVESPNILMEILGYLHQHYEPKTKEYLLDAAHTNPYLIPALSDLAYISEREAHRLIQENISQAPFLYLHLNDVQKCDPSIIIATLAGDRSPGTLRTIPYKKLDPHFVLALLKIWPEIRTFLRNERAQNHQKLPDYLSNLPCVDLTSPAMFATLTAVNLILLSLIISAFLLPTVFPALMLLSTSIVFAAMVSMEFYLIVQAVPVYEEKLCIQQSLGAIGFFKHGKPNSQDDESIEYELKHPSLSV